MIATLLERNNIDDFIEKISKINNSKVLLMIPKRPKTEENSQGKSWMT